MHAATFAPHLPAPLASHVFGRFLVRKPQAAHAPAVPAKALPAALWSAGAPAVEADEADLAQRVRESGEW